MANLVTRLNQNGQLELLIDRGAGDGSMLRSISVHGQSNTTPPTLTDGQTAPVQLDTRGNQSTILRAPNAIGSLVGTDADAQATLNTYALLARDSQFNGTTWDRVYGTQDLSILASASRTTTQTGADLTNYNARGVKLVVDMTVVGTGSITVTIQGKDVVSGKYYTILASAAIITNVTGVYTVYPSAPVATNVSANDQLPRIWRVVVTANNANAATYSVGASMLL